MFILSIKQAGICPFSPVNLPILCQRKSQCGGLHMHTDSLHPIETSRIAATNVVYHLCSTNAWIRSCSVDCRTSAVVPSLVQSLHVTERPGPSSAVSRHQWTDTDGYELSRFPEPLQ